MDMGFLQNEHSRTRNNQQIIKWQRQFDKCMHLHTVESLVEDFFGRIFTEDMKL